MVAVLGVVAVLHDRDRLAERRPHVVVVHACGHHAHDHLERARLGHLDLLDLEGVLRFAVALLADHPRRHRAGQLAGLGVDGGDLLEIDCHCALNLVFRVKSAPSGRSVPAEQAGPMLPGVPAARPMATAGLSRRAARCASTSRSPDQSSLERRDLDVDEAAAAARDRACPARGCRSRARRRGAARRSTPRRQGRSPRRARRSPAASAARAEKNATTTSPGAPAVSPG